MKNIDKYPCQCGHLKEMHRIPMATGKMGCSVTQDHDNSRWDYPEYADECEEFKPDNLKYLEDLSEH